MGRLIVLSFLALGWIFYEMSGGSDFDPDALKAARIAEAEAERAERGLPARPAPAEVAEDTPAPVTIATAPAVPTLPQPVQQAAATPRSDEDVTRVSLDLTSVQQTVTTRTTPVVPAQDQESDITETPSVTVAASNVASTITTSADTPAIIPSLIAPRNAQPLSLEELAPGIADIRTVSGDRVNVRGGPGTNFGVVTQLLRGDAVEILEDTGNGWVRFEALDSDAAGWVADFLLTGG